MRNSYHSSSEWLEKAGRMSSHLLAGHNEERLIVPHPQHGKCHWAGMALDRPLWRLLATSRTMMMMIMMRMCELNTVTVNITERDTACVHPSVFLKNIKLRYLAQWQCGVWICF